MPRNPKEVTQMRKLISKIKANCPKLEYLEDLEKWVNSGVWSWPPRLKEVPPSKINRCSDVLNGPIYSCEGYEWPTHKDLPMIPFIQLDLRRCSRVSGVDLGTGLLQVWYGFDQFMGKDAYIRVVPADQVHKNKLLPVPAFDIEKMKASFGPAYFHWADTGRRHENATQITRYKPRRFTLPHTYTFRDENMDQTRGLSKECKRMIKELDSMIEFANDRFGTGLHLMGTFSSVQYSPSECPTPFFCFDGNETECHNFGDGNGQLFFEKTDNGKLTFSFDWSCL
jgi:hypothetical protein